MTQKQLSIIESALYLFAENGFDAISTRKIAEHANVSEGLIFRHFTNKEGLLSAILELGHERANQYFSTIIHLQDPKARIEAVLDLPIEIPIEDYPFWRLTYALKWQRGSYRDFSKELEVSLNEAFDQLGYSESSLEAKLLLVYVDGLATEILLKGTECVREINQLMKDKYQL